MTEEKNDQFEEIILNYVASENYKPAKPKIIAKKLKIAEDSFVEFRRTVKRLVRKKKLSWGPKHLVMPGKPTEETDSKSKSKSKSQSKPSDDAILGRFRKSKNGYGFVTPEVASDILEDIHIPERMTIDATNGDIVKVQILKNRKGSNPGLAGRILEVVERSTYQFVGSYFESEPYGYVSVDREAFPDPIMVGDAGAKDCQRGDQVVIEMVKFPSHHSPGEAVIVKVLGAHNQPGVDTQTIIHEFQLPEEFPEAVIEDARKQAEKFDAQQLEEGRKDLTSETIITIDPKEARDFDDAISLKRIEKDHWVLGVHIADVSHFVRPNTHLDSEAYKRATSVYLPDKVVPMLPETISNNLASLQPNRVRFTQSVFIEYSPDGLRIHTETTKAAIKSCRRFSYEEIDEFLADPEPWKEKESPEVIQLLGHMHELAMILRNRRMNGGAIELALPDVKILLADDGKVDGAKLVEHTQSHQIIEEFMLAANEAVAEKLGDLQLPYLRRIHEAPDPRKLKFLTEFVRELGIPCESLESRFEIKRVIQEAANKPVRHAVNFSILRSMKKAKYSPQDFGHYALASKAYCHFTSPIRRYPDLVIHRMIASLQENRTPATDFSQMMKIGNHCSRLEENAEQAERQLIRLKLLNYLSTRIGTELKSFITGVTANGFFAQGIDLPAEGFISIDSLPDDIYDFDPTIKCLTGRRTGNSYRLGDNLVVKVAKVDLGKRTLDFLLAGASKKRPARAQKAFSVRASSDRGTKRTRPKKNKSKSQQKKRKKRK